MGSRQSLFQGGRFHLVFVSELCRDPWRKYDKAGQVAFADYSNICVSPGRWVSGIVERCWHTVVEKSPYLWFKVGKTLELFDSLDQGRNILALFPNLVFLVSFWFLLDLWKKTCSFILLSGLVVKFVSGYQRGVMVSWTIVIHRTKPTQRYLGWIVGRGCITKQSKELKISTSYLKENNYNF